MTDDPTEQPLLRVVHGNPTDEEIAALVALFASRSAVAPAPPPTRTSGWSAYARSVRAPLQPGPGSWRMSGRP